MNWIVRLGLQPHPEGGWFRRIYTDARQIETAYGPRAALTSIHYLLTRESPIGHLHRNRSRILHYLQDGGPVEYFLLAPSGELRREVLGRESGQSLFLDVPGLCWKASRLCDGAEHALVSEVVTPGFDDADHAFMTLSALQREFPPHLTTLREFVRDS